jgi:hypothetical protein
MPAGRTGTLFPEIDDFLGSFLNVFLVSFYKKKELLTPL